MLQLNYDDIDSPIDNECAWCRKSKTGLVLFNRNSGEMGEVWRLETQQIHQMESQHLIHHRQSQEEHLCTWKWTFQTLRDKLQFLAECSNTQNSAKLLEQNFTIDWQEKFKFSRKVDIHEKSGKNNFENFSPHEKSKMKILKTKIQRFQISLLKNIFLALKFS